MPKAKKVLPKSVKIEVTAKDIKKSIKEDAQGDPFSCPIANAVYRVLGDSPAVSGNLEVSDSKGFVLYYDLPEKAHKFMSKFDDNEDVKPFSFIAKAEEDTYRFYQEEREQQS